MLTNNISFFYKNYPCPNCLKDYNCSIMKTISKKTEKLNEVPVPICLLTSQSSYSGMNFDKLHTKLHICKLLSHIQQSCSPEYTYNTKWVTYWTIFWLLGLHWYWLNPPTSQKNPNIFCCPCMVHIFMFYLTVHHSFGYKAAGSLYIKRWV